jgi:hypothetical protein
MASPARRRITMPDGTALWTAARYAEAAGSPDWDGKCCAERKNGGGRCRGNAMTGQIVCRLHGGQSEQARAGAAGRLHQVAIRGQVADMLDKYEELVPDGMDPLTGLLEVVTRTWLMVRVYGDLVAGLATHSTAEVELVQVGEGRTATDVTITEPALIDPNHLGDLRTNPLVRDYREWIAAHAKACKLALDAGVEERQVRLAEQQAQGIVTAVQAALDALELTPEQADKAPAVVANLLSAVAGEG